MEGFVGHCLRRKLTEVGHAILVNQFWIGLGYVFIQLLQVADTDVVQLARTLQSDGAVEESMHKLMQQNVGTGIAIDQLNLIGLCIVLTSNNIVTLSTQCTFSHHLNRWQFVRQ